MTRIITIAIALLVCTPLRAAAQTPGCGAIGADARLSEVGAFSNMRYTQEHAYGYTVLLWRAGDCYVGLFEASQGLAGDTPIGELQDLKYDGRTGRLSFSSKLTMGRTSVAGTRDMEPSHDLFAFDGSLKGNAVTGVMTYTLENNRNVKPARTKLALRRSKAEAEFMHGSVTYSEWRRRWNPVLQRRGPQW